MPTQPSQSWSHLKTHLQRLDKEALLLLLRDLYALNADSKVFLSGHFLVATPEELMAPYRRTSARCSTLIAACRACSWARRARQG